MYTLYDTPGTLPDVIRRRRSTATRCSCTGISLPVSVGQRRQNAATYPLYGTSRSSVSIHCLYSPRMFHVKHSHVSVLRCPEARWLSS